MEIMIGHFRKNEMRRGKCTELNFAVVNFNKSFFPAEMLFEISSVFVRQL